MGFYELSKEKRQQLVSIIREELLADLKKNKTSNFHKWFSDPDTYIRKSAYESIGKIHSGFPEMRDQIVSMLNKLFKEKNHHIRQTVVNAAGEIGKVNFEIVREFFDQGLFDSHHSVRNAVIGSIKKMGQKNPEPVIKWAWEYLHHSDKEIRREICHGIELRGRTHPQDILPLLKELQFDKTSRVYKTLVHVIGQISYKKDCLSTVINEIKTWENKQLVDDGIKEIIEVHDRYKDFSFLTQKECISYISSVINRS